MEYYKPAIEYKEGQTLLFDGSYRAIPFNITMATLLAIYLSYNGGPNSLILVWLVGMVIISSIRMIHCKLVIKKQLLDTSYNVSLKLFLILTMITGFVWAWIYFISIPYVDAQQQYVVLLVFGGMSAGATTSLAVYSTAFFVYIMSIFVPVILYNYSTWEFNPAILATMFAFFLLAITIIAKSQQRLLTKIFFLTEENKALMNKFEMLSITDALTGLYNRRHFTKAMQEEHNRAKRNQQSLVLVSIDIDNFKLINDNFGHPFGDKFLIYVAYYLKHYLRRANDIVFRLGGDEFSALLINTTEESAKDICEQIRSQFIKNPVFDYEPQDSEHKIILDKISLSMGVVYVPHDSNATIEEVLDKVDKLLYQAKHHGKNEIEYSKIV